MRVLALCVIVIAAAAPTANGATFTVTRADDAALATCAAGNCTLRAAIVAANTAAGADTIAFNVAPAAPGEPARIVPTSALPPLSADDTTIDGFTQPGAVPGTGIPDRFTSTLKIVIDGAQAGATSGLRLTGNRATVRGVSILGFAVAQIDISGSSNIVRSNLIGMTPAGDWAATLPLYGVRIANTGSVRPTANQIGGSYSPIQGNVIAGNRTGVLLDGVGNGTSLAEENRVSGNLINIGPDGVYPTPGEHGVHLRNSSNSRVGSSSNSPFVDGNNIGGATGPDSIGVVVNGGSRTFVEGNWIGGNSNGAAHPLGTGILVTQGATEVFAQYNQVIAARQNGIEVRDGTAAPGSTSALLAQNWVLSVGGLAIDLNGDGPTPNDVDDADTGPNRLTNVPVLSNPRIVGSDYLIDFTVDAETNTNYGVEAMVKIKPGSVGPGPSAKASNPYSLDAVVAVPSIGGSVRTDANGIATGTLTVARTFVEAGRTLAATASRSVTFGGGNGTSEVSAGSNAAVFPAGTTLSLTEGLEVTTHESATQLFNSVSVARTGSSVGQVSVRILAGIAPSDGTHVTLPAIPSPNGLQLTWPDGDTAPKTFLVGYTGLPPAPERHEVVFLQIEDPVGATLGQFTLYYLVVGHPTRLGELESMFSRLGGSFEDNGAPGN